MYIPKKKKWNTLGEFKHHLEKETKEKILFFNGWKLVTTDTQYGIVDSVLYASPRVHEEIKITGLGNRPKVPKKAKKKKEPVIKEKSRKQILEEMKERGRKALEAKKKKGKKKS